MIIALARLSVFYEVFWKSGVVLGAALCINALLRNKSADVRRLVLSIAVTAMFVAALAWPALPRWTAVMPVWLRPGNPTAAAFEPAEPAIGGGGTQIAIPVIRMTEPGLPLRSEPRSSIFIRTPVVIPLIWFAGTILLLARFFNSLCGLRRLRYASDAASGTDLRAHLDRVMVRLGRARNRSVALLQNESIGAPVTWGIVRPVILVPAGFEHLPNECRDAVLCHELAHIQAHDFLLRGLAEIACALIWFQPLIWIVRRQLREEQELACDNRVLAAGSKPSVYARLLLDWDLCTGTETSIAVGMAHRSCLGRRLYALLDDDLRRNPVARIGILATWFLALATTLPLTAINLAPAILVQPAAPNTLAGASFEQVPATRTEQIPAIRPQRVPAARSSKLSTTSPEMRGQLAQALQTAGANVRAVSTPLPRLRSDTCLVVVNAAVTDLNGKAIDGLSAKDFVLTEDGMAQAISTFALQKVDNATQDISGSYVLGYYTMNCQADGTFRKTGIALTGGTQATVKFREGYFARNGPPGEFDRKVGAHFTLDGANDTESKASPPAVLFKKDPEYPEQARKAKWNGTVALLAEIGATGKVTSVTVIRSAGMGLDEKAVDAVTQWKFRPGTRNGNPVATQVQVDLGFRLF
jgi:TonB family protein